MAMMESKPPRGSVWRVILINLAVLVCLLATAEIAARLYIAWRYGTQTAGMQERTAYLSYEPFVMYGPDWDQFFSSIEPPKGKTCRIMMVGGSVAAGFPNKVLEQAISAKYKDKRFEIINGAYGGYEARQEVIVAALWAPSLSPDLLLSLDGANDLEHRLRVKRAGRFYLNATYEAFLEHPLLAPLYFAAVHSQVYNAMLRAFARYDVGALAQYSDAVPIYIDAEKSLNRLARGIGATRLMVLQPFSGFKSHLSKEEAQFTLFKFREGVMKDLYTLTDKSLAEISRRDGVLYLDGRSLFMDARDHIFTDDVHLTPDGYRRLANAIADLLGSSWAANCSH